MTTAQGSSDGWLLADRARSRALGELSRLWRRELVSRGVTVGRDVQILGRPIVSRAPASTIRLGDRVMLISDSRSTALGVAHPVVLRTLAPGAALVLGDDVGISGGSLCAAGRVEIGRGALIGADVMITDTNFHNLHHPDRRRAGIPRSGPDDPVVIDENVFIGAGCMVLAGVAIGANTVVGAHSVITESLPADCVAAGNPCRVLHPL
jgi:acetyltransferase-like isoleucine patch superfamily enzyme